MKRSLSLSIVLATLVPSFALAQVDSLSFQGLLTDPGGAGYDTTVTVTTKLYKGGTEVYSQAHPGTVVNNGVFNLTIGPMGTVAFDQPIDLGVKVGSNPEISPRTHLQAAPFALGLRGLYTVPASSSDTLGINLVGGPGFNGVGSGVVGGTISGGGARISGALRSNQVLGHFGTVGGGYSNIAGGLLSTVSGGQNNHAFGVAATIAGGVLNDAGGLSATIAGGLDNEASAGSKYATVGGGRSNKVTGENSWVGGGRLNRATGLASAVPGGYENHARAEYTLAAGQRARAKHDGTFVWDDAESYSGKDSLVSTGVNQFLIRAAGGVGIGTNAPLAIVHVRGTDTGIRSSHTSSESILVDDLPAVVGLYSGEDGSWGSGIVLAETDVIFNPGPEWVLKNKWAIVRETFAAGNDLAFKFGTSADHTVNDTEMRIQSNGNVYADGAFTGGGADLAEAVEVLGPVDEFESGDVLVVSPTRDRTFEKSDGAYSTRVAGVMATKPGFVMSERGMNEDFADRIPLAITGIVPTKVSAENGPISRGDLLVTSSTPCHAMKADPDRLGFGMILGKALQPFDGKGAGLIEVLVNVR